MYASKISYNDSCNVTYASKIINSMFLQCFMVTVIFAEMTHMHALNNKAVLAVTRSIVYFHAIPLYLRLAHCFNSVQFMRIFTLLFGYIIYILITTVTSCKYWQESKISVAMNYLPFQTRISFAENSVLVGLFPSKWGNKYLLSKLFKIVSVCFGFLV